MRAALFLAGTLVLGGCNTPSSDFAGLEAETVTIGGSTFDVRVNGAEAEAIRTNPEASFSFAAVADRARLAMEQVSGCAVRPGTLEGDAALVRAALDCG